jgi:hypothetical protein
MPAKPPCANCGAAYVRGHRWAGANPGECKVPPPGQKTFYREQSASSPAPQRAGA